MVNKPQKLLLNFITIQLDESSSQTNSQIFIALVDNGSTHSLLSNDTFKKISGKNILYTCNTKLRLAAITKNLNILGKTILFITIYDISNHKNIGWYQEFYVADQLSHEVFIGNDILNSKKVYLSTNNELIFTKNTNKKFNTRYLKNKNDYIIVPFIKSDCL